MVVIEKFKSAYPDWHATDWSNVYLELNDSAAYVCDFKDENLSRGEKINYDNPDFVPLFADTIDKVKAASATPLLEIKSD